MVGFRVVGLLLVDENADTVICLAVDRNIRGIRTIKRLRFSQNDTVGKCRAQTQCTDVMRDGVTGCTCRTADRIAARFNCNPTDGFCRVNAILTFFFLQSDVEPGRGDIGRIAVDRRAIIVGHNRCQHDRWIGKTA